jgi:hypothetical protein
MMIAKQVRLGANAGERRSECERGGSTWVGRRSNELGMCAQDCNVSHSDLV